LVNRENYHLVRAYLEHLRDTGQLGSGSISRYRFLLRHLLLWADEVPLPRVDDVRPSFPTYLRDRCRGKAQASLAPATLKKTVQVARAFLGWVKSEHPRDFKDLPKAWIDGLRAPRVSQAPGEHRFVGLDEVLRIASLKVPEDDMATRRDQAAACLLFLSGMRASALGSLPIRAVDVSKRELYQWPSLGVRTKNAKSATTFLLDVPALVGVVAAWDTFIRTRLPETAMWYTPTISNWGEQKLSSGPPGSNRNVALAKRLRLLFSAAGIPYQSPHKFRHGHAVYALQHARTMADYKAVSMNLMHADISITDGIYAPLASDEVQRRIAELTGEPRTARQGTYTSHNDRASRQEIARELMDIARQLGA
jgi:site-specific recombinase XerC